ncbi:MAG TPA: hypothetical protein VNL70_05780, partial [Tepidisphaeraceae bacterium]|nr:hypothetical protein [Tepidisphaeraceae bacterium]
MKIVGIVRRQCQHPEAQTLRRPGAAVLTVPAAAVQFHLLMIITHVLGRFVELKDPSQEMPLWRYVYGG